MTTDALAALVVALATVIPAAASGRQLVGEFCTNPDALPKPGACISLSYGGQTAQGYTNSPNRVLTLRPGTYWLRVNDNSTAHNFAPSLEHPDFPFRWLTFPSPQTPRAPEGRAQSVSGSAISADSGWFA